MGKLNYVFQIDSDVVQEVYNQDDNFIIQYEEKQECKEKFCAIYFSSNEIYYPNDVLTFEKTIKQKNKFEWFNTRINKVKKHIFIRDIRKQWYLTGINQSINSIEKLVDFLKKETCGYKIITVGSSSGGYAASLIGSMLGAHRIYSFNGQFFLYDLFEFSNERLDPIIFREKNNPFINQYYSIKENIKESNSLFYCYSNQSDWDVRQLNHVDGVGIYRIAFKTKHHGVPFLKSNLHFVLNANEEWLVDQTKYVHHPLFFSFKIEGIIRTFISLFNQIAKALVKKCSTLWTDSVYRFNQPL